MVSMKANAAASSMNFPMAFLCLGLTLFSFSFAHAVAPPSNGSGACAADGTMDSAVESEASQAAGVLGLSAQVSAWKEARASCKETNLTAQTECFEACSKKAQSGLSGANALGSLMNIVGGLTNKTCGQQGQAAQQMQQGYEGYSASCKSAQKTCVDDCGAALKAGEALQQAAQAKMCNGDPNCEAAKPKVMAAVNKDKGSAKTFSQGKNAQCKTDFAGSLSRAAELLKGIGDMLAAAKGCQEESAQGPGATADASDCKILANQTTQKCICETPGNERLPGCENGLEKMASAGTSKFAAGEVPGLNAKNAEDVNLGKSDKEPMAFPAGTGDLNAAGMLAGGGGGAGGGPGSPSSEGKDGHGKSGLNANILGGDAGGGGGGGGGWGSPASKPDPKGRSMAGAAARPLAPGAPGFTGAGGRSNWDKVKERYKDNRPTFLND